MYTVTPSSLLDAVSFVARRCCIYMGELGVSSLLNPESSVVAPSTLQLCEVRINLHSLAKSQGLPSMMTSGYCRLLQICLCVLGAVVPWSSGTKAQESCCST